jgi:hypothetical protein
MMMRTTGIGYEGKASACEVKTPIRLAGILSFTRWVTVPIARWGGVPRFVLRA